MNIARAAASAATGVVGEVMSGVDKLFTSDAEREAARLAAQKVADHPLILQAMANIEAAKHPSTFVAGGRPFLIWVCGFGWILKFILPFGAWLGAMFGFPPPVGDIDTTALLGLTAALLGYRSFEKVKGVARDNLNPFAPNLRFQ